MDNTMTINIDRAWAEHLGITHRRGVTRSGEFYKVPRRMYKSLVATNSPCFQSVAA